MTINWVFDPAPASGRRSGGNAAEYGFEGKIDTLVREVVQNSLDASISDDAVEIRFRIVELTGDKLQEFLEAIRWEALYDNLNSIDRHGKQIHRAIEALENNDKILLLCIEDYNTHGLTGTDRREDDSSVNRFSALVRDELYSDKDTEDAGGSYGLGKILLWAYSAFKTVIFVTAPDQTPDDRAGLRLIGRTSLPFHETDQDGKCDGPGWLGIPRQEEDEGTRGRWAESVWGAEAHDVALACCVQRDEQNFGLSTVIVGFEEPGQETRPVDDLLTSIERAALESFWPSITRKQLTIKVQYEQNGELRRSEAVDPSKTDDFGELAELLSAFDSGLLEEKKVLQKSGESTVISVDIELPAKITGNQHPEKTGQVAVLVRLLEEDERYDQIRDKIYRFRGPGMIVRSAGASSLSISARPYVGAVVCGKAREVSEIDEQVERFLRSAEPPEHDKWQPDTRAVKENYKTHGVKAKLDRFENSIKSAIRGVVSLPEKSGGALPKELLKHLRFGDSSGGGSPRFLSAAITASNDGKRWSFKVKVRRKKSTEPSPWHARVRLKYAVDGGTSEDVRAISGVSCTNATDCGVSKGYAWLEFPEEINQATIEGTTDPALLPVLGMRAQIEIRVDGGPGASGDA